MKTGSYVLSLLLVFVALSLALGAEPTAKQWEGIELKNDVIALKVVPAIGGRVIQYKLGDYGFFWVNGQLAGTEPPASGVGPNGEWLNYGGDKLWPGPQGWDNEQQWPGPPDAVLDGSPYTAKVIKENNKLKAIELTSREDKRSGIQFSRVIKIFDETTHVSIDATMKNIDTKERRWGIWSHTQFNAGNRHGDGHNENYRAYCPINPKSIFPRGYGVIFGLAQNPSFKPNYEKGMMEVHYQRRVGKIGMDSDAGWIATVDGTDGYVFVQRFKYEKGKEYPDDSSVEFWMNGVGEIYAYNKIIQMAEDPLQNPYNFESEMMGHYALLQPGESTSFHYDWYAAKIGSGLAILDCSEVGVCCEPLSAKLSGDTIFDLNLDGQYGVFYKGKMQVELLDKRDNKIRTLATMAVTPLEPVKPPKFAGVAGQLKIPENAAKVVLYVYDSKGKLLGELARAEIVRN